MPTTFQLLASHPALDFVNTLDDRFVPNGPNELLRTYVDFLAFMQQAEALSTRQVGLLRARCHSAQAANVLARAHTLREALSAVFYGIAARGRPPPDALKHIESYVSEARSHRYLVWARAGRPDANIVRAKWDWVGSSAHTELPLWAITESAVELLTSGALAQVHECKSPTCRWLFLDTSKNHSRRWCDMKICGNRMKARRFRLGNLS